MKFLFIALCLHCTTPKEIILPDTAPIPEPRPTLESE